ncbi:MAG: butyrate kinase [Sphaerochaetaceae bacterium]|nr:butyrate kinase [Sphaerochaetaceae bacterium]
MSERKLLVINPGSTSTKISLFSERENLFTESVFHDAPELMNYPTANDQLPMRKKVVISILEKHGYSLSDVDVFIGRGGCAYSQKSGVMVIDKTLRDDTMNDVGGSDHPAKLGVMMAYDFGTEFNKPMFTVNPTNVDEFIPEARVTGIKGLYRRAQTHALNQKATARMHAEKNGRKYEDMNLIVCHIDGGITITAHEKGKMIDSTEGAGGDGPFSPTRLGSIPIIEVLIFLKDHSIEEMHDMCSRDGGFVSHFGTSNSDTIHKKVEEGDRHATLVWNTVIYQISKSIGEMACVLKGKVDGILLTGGLVRFSDIVEGIEDRCSWIAPVSVYPGEVEQEAMCYPVLDVLDKKREANVYTGKPVFSGFDFIC